MGRPRKSADEADARQRIEDALWALLADHQLHEITVGALTERAGCNRGTFYYHYHDLDSLVESAIEDELVGSGAIARIIFLMGAGQQCDRLVEEAAPHLQRMGLIVRRSGFDVALLKTREVVMRLWRAVLCPDGSDMTPEAERIVEYNLGGVLGQLTLAEQYAREGEILPQGSARFLQRNSVHMLEAIAAAQGISKEDIVSRLVTVSHLVALTGGTGSA